MTTAVRAGARCLRTFHPKENAAARLVAFPHAGGTARAFAELSYALPEDIGLEAVQYPGRHERRSDPHAEEIAVLADEAAQALAETADHRPLFLAGLSMGALVAFETARRLAATGTVTRLIVSAALPPSRDWEERDLDACADGEIVAELRRLGGVPEELLRDEETVRQVVGLLRADHRALRRYRCPADTALTVPVTVLLGDADPKADADRCRGWADHTTRDARTELLPGGHFALADPGTGSALRLTDRIRTDLI
ncbi:MULTISPECIES: thioesterase II family protein [unclassified Streptomyces]|uniref:thioesterase II family protein n=1 Tax=unclassified Streptomyces TaxID=2593676 RepID=UPI0011E6853A|nr:alpha/beta fold hydrolase [Streptomyces sp. sk2.1]TXS75706.1 thioesterase [Streptomyces sp. sk2.1]